MMCDIFRFSKTVSERGTTVVILSDIIGMYKMRIMIRWGPDKKHTMWEKPANGEAMWQEAFLWEVLQSKTLLIFYGHQLINSPRSQGHRYQGWQLAHYLGLWSGGQDGGRGINQDHTVCHRTGIQAFLESHTSNHWWVLPAPLQYPSSLWEQGGKNQKLPSDPHSLIYLFGY